MEGNSSVLFNADGLGKNVFTKNANSEEKFLVKISTPWIGRETTNGKLEDRSMIINLGRFKKYLFEIESSYNIDHLKSTLGSAFKNAVTGDTIIPKFLIKTEDLDENKVYVSSGYIKKTENKIHILGPGEVILSSNLIINTGEELIVKPGSILMADGVSLFSKVEQYLMETLKIN